MKIFAFVGAALLFAATPVMAADAAPAPAATTPAAAAPATAAPATKAATPAAAPAVDAPAPAAPVDGIGQPTPGGIGLQPQFTQTGQFAQWMHNAILMPVIVVISLFVLVLLMWVMVRYNTRANPVPSKTTHNTFIEVVWTAVPVVILAAVFVPSFTLLRAQYAKPPANAVTIKATGNQWFWTYKYPDNGDFEIVSNMLPDDKAEANHEPRMLAADNRMVVPVNTPIKMIITSNDVIHSFAIPAFWTKMDAVPGHLNEISFQPQRVGVYYGQCSALCGARHAYMPIAVEVVTPEKYAQWVAAHGGHAKGAAAPAASTAAAAPVATLAKN